MSRFLRRLFALTRVKISYQAMIGRMLMACFTVASMSATHVAAKQLLVIDVAPNVINQTPWGQSSLSSIEPVLRMHVHGIDTNSDPDIVRFEEGAFQADFAVSVSGAGWLDVMQTQQAAGFEFNIATNTAPQFERLFNGSGNDVSLSGSLFSAFDRSLNNAFIQGNITGAQFIPEPSSVMLLMVGSLLALLRRRGCAASSPSGTDTCLQLA